MWGPGPGALPLTSAHHHPPAGPALGLTVSAGAHFWRVSTSPSRPEVQQKAKVSAPRTCRLLSSPLSLAPGRQRVEEKSCWSHMGLAMWQGWLVTSPFLWGTSPVPGGRNHVFPPLFISPFYTARWVLALARPFQSWSGSPLKPGLDSHSSRASNLMAGGAGKGPSAAVPEAYVVFWDSRSTTFRSLSRAPCRTLGAPDGKMETLGQRLPSFSCTAMVLTAFMTSRGKGGGENPQC